MKKLMINSLLFFSALLILSACGDSETEQGEISEISYGTFIKFLEEKDSKPFFFIVTDEKEATFNKDDKQKYEDFLTKQDTGAFYLNLSKISDKKIDALNKKIAAKYTDEINDSFDVRDDYMLLIQDESLENIEAENVST